MKRFFVLIGAILLLFSLTACDSPRQAEDDTSATEPVSIPEQAVIPVSSPIEPVPAPEEEEEVLLCTFRLYNSTDHTVTALSFREADEPAYTVNLLQEDLKDGESIVLNYNTAPALRAFEEAQASESEDTPLLTPEFRLLVLLEDGSWHELAAFPLEDADEGTLLYEDGIVYLSYESFSTGHLISTKDAQRWILSWGNTTEPDYSALARPSESTPSEEASPTEESSVPEMTPSEEDGSNEKATDMEEAAQPQEAVSQPAEDPAPEEDEEYDPDAGCLTGGLFH